MPSCADMLSTYCPRLPPSMATASGHLMFLVHETKGAPDFSCWLALNISMLCHCHPQLHQATSCCKRAHVSGAWCMSATGLYIFSRWFDMLKYPPVRKSAHVSGAYVHYYFKVILMLMVSARHPPITWVTTWVSGKRLRISNFSFWQTFWK